MRAVRALVIALLTAFAGCIPEQPDGYSIRVSLYTDIGRAVSLSTEKHEIEDLNGNVKVEFSWRRGRKWESLKMSAAGEPQPIPAGSHAEFITEHYWGYTALPSGCSEYRVEHPRWKIWNATGFKFNADVAALYGDQFVEVLNVSPRCAFIAEGSPITVQKRQILL